MTYLKRGDIYMCISSGEIGHEIYGNRPVIIMSPQSIIERYNVANVVPLSTTLRGGEEHAVIKSSKYTSIAMCEQLKSVDVGRLTEKLGEVSEKELQAIELSIKAATGMFDEEKEESSETLKIQLETYKQLYDDLLEKVCQKN